VVKARFLSAPNRRLIGLESACPLKGVSHLKQSGFVEGQNVAMEYRWAEGRDDRLPELAADLVRRRVAVIVGHSTAVQAAKAASSTTPIIFVIGNDPVRIGLVASLNRPGGNVTGVTFTTIDVMAKRLGQLHELVPGAELIGGKSGSDPVSSSVTHYDYEGNHCQ